MRKAKALSRRSVVKALPELTAIQIRQFERGEASPPACLFFELTKIYEADPMQIESALLEAADCIRTNRQ